MIIDLYRGAARLAFPALAPDVDAQRRAMAWLAEQNVLRKGKQATLRAIDMLYPEIDQPPKPMVDALGGFIR